jgi:hypothetical protein
MKKITLSVYSEPGHGWCKVRKELLNNLSIENNITTYSYMRGDYAYLEEDCDLGTLINALKAKGCTNISFKEFNTNRQSKIRGYSHYSLA